MDGGDYMLLTRYQSVFQTKKIKSYPNLHVRFKNVCIHMHVMEHQILICTVWYQMKVATNLILHLPIQIRRTTFLKYVTVPKDTVTIVRMNLVIQLDVDFALPVLVLEIKDTKEQVVALDVNCVLIQQQIKFYLVLDL